MTGSSPAPVFDGFAAGARCFAALLAALLVLLPARASVAQSPLDPSGQGAIPGALPQQPQPGKKGQQPEGGAASGGEQPSQLPTQAPQLPEEPNAIPKQLEPKLGSDFDPDTVEHSRARKTKYRIYGPYYEEVSGGYRFRAIFPPLWMERLQKVDGGWDRGSLFGLNYFNRRSPQHDADIFFPFFWKLRDGKTYTTVVAPFMHREGPEGHDNWFAPLFVEGSRKKTGTEFLHIPPLLTFHHRDREGGFSMAGPAFCRWRGGAFCDGRTATKIDMGIAPLYFYGRDEKSEYEVIPPLLHFYRYREAGNHVLDVWGPVWREKHRGGGLLNVLPLFFHNWDEQGTRTTLFPVFHYSNVSGDRTIITPLFFHRATADGGRTFATYLYARHRGRTELDMFTPLVWLYRDPDIKRNSVLVFPFVYRNTSNRSSDLVVFPFYANFRRYGLSNSHWVTPLVNWETSITGWNTNVFPIFFAGRQNRNTHLVVAPIVWDFASPKSRQTVVFPLFWRFADQKGVTQIVGNTIYLEEKTDKGTEWQFHFFPLFSFGSTPEGHWWNLLYGLAGYTREGTMAKMRMLYIPIEISKKER
jgi:hypothetical protein